MRMGLKFLHQKPYAIFIKFDLHNPTFLESKFTAHISACAALHSWIQSSSPHRSPVLNYISLDDHGDTFENVLKMRQALILKHVTAHLTDFLALRPYFQCHLSPILCRASSDKVIKNLLHPFNPSIGWQNTGLENAYHTRVNAQLNDASYLAYGVGISYHLVPSIPLL
jgi:hypothetical protein